jgi:aminoglycoside/choline kinase family phosphotransferase
MIGAENLLRQTRLHFPAFDRGKIDITPIEKGGSGRKFYRVQFSPGQSVILVKYTREQEENERFVEIARFLTDHRIPAPRIHFHDPAEGLIWMEDLGGRDLWSYREESWEVRRPLYRSALVAVARLHRLPEEVTQTIQPHLAARFNAALYRWEQGYFFEYCLGRHFGVGPQTLKNLAAIPALKKIAEHLASFPRVLVHRDFQSQNLIVREGEACLIDFQGMRPGLGEYDLASLLYDPYVSLTSKEQEELRFFYEEERGERDPAFMERLELCALQRLMQALGGYGYLGRIKGNTAFLVHIPPALRSLGKIAGGLEGLEPLSAELQALQSRP